jgi:hypothetical protein
MESAAPTTKAPGRARGGKAATAPAATSRQSIADASLKKPDVLLTLDDASLREAVRLAIEKKYAKRGSATATASASASATAASAIEQDEEDAGPGGRAPDIGKLRESTLIDMTLRTMRMQSKAAFSSSDTPALHVSGMIAARSDRPDATRIVRRAAEEGKIGTLVELLHRDELISLHARTCLPIGATDLTMSPDEKMIERYGKDLSDVIGKNGVFDVLRAVENHLSTTGKKSMDCAELASFIESNVSPVRFHTPDSRQLSVRILECAAEKSGVIDDFSGKIKFAHERVVSASEKSRGRQRAQDE